MKQDLIGFAPDIAVTEPGIITDCTNIIPVPKGLAAAPSPVDLGIPALAADCKGFAVARKLDDTNRTFAGTQAALYELVSGSWSDVSSAAYTGGIESRWRFAQFGDATIATNRADAVQVSLSGSFANLAGSPPKASIAEVVNGFVMLFDVNDATYGYGDSPDRWWCSGLYNHETWSPSTATQAATGRLFDSPGKILAGRRLGADIVAYKEKAMYIGIYQGPPLIWGWQEVSNNIGAVSQEAVVNVGTAHIFASHNDFYMFDGSRPISIGDHVREWYQNRLSISFKHRVTALHDRARSLVYFFFPSTSSSSGDPDTCLVYNYARQLWGRYDRPIQAAAQYVTEPITYDTLGNSYATYDDLPDVSYDSPFWTTSTQVPAYVDDTGTLKTMSGTPGVSSITTGDVGDDDQYSELQRITPHFLTTPDSATLTPYKRSTGSDSYTAGTAVSISRGRFDTLQCAQWHRVKLDFSGSVELTGLNWALLGDSEE